MRFKWGPEWEKAQVAVQDAQDDPPDLMYFMYTGVWGSIFFVDGLFLLLMVIVYCCVVLCFERGPCSVIQASLELCAAQDGLKHTMILLPQSPECRDYMPVTLPSAAQVN